MMPPSLAPMPVPVAPFAAAPVPPRGGDAAHPLLERGGGGGRHVGGAVDAALHPSQEMEELLEEPRALRVGPRLPLGHRGCGPPRLLHHRRQPLHLLVEGPRLACLLLPHLVEEQGVVVDQRAHQRHRLGRVWWVGPPARVRHVGAEEGAREDGREGAGGERGGDARGDGCRGWWGLLVLVPMLVLVGLGRGVVAGPPEEVREAAEGGAMLEGKVA